MKRLLSKRSKQHQSPPVDFASYSLRSGGRRIAFYSHDTMGLGHSRRNHLLAQTLAKSNSQTNILMIGGVQERAAWAMPPKMDALTLPGLSKNSDGSYRTRYWDLPLQELIRLRTKIIRAAVKAFKPDIFIVDNVPRGALGEIDATLKFLYKHCHTHCILGLRDVLDDPKTVRYEWERAENEEAIRRYYDAVWVYGDPNVYDLVREYQLSPEVAAKVSYLGYLDQRPRLKFVKPDAVDPIMTLGLPPGQLVLCLVGGGQDGANLAEAFSQAVLPPATNGVIVTGPFIPPDVQQRLYRRAASNPNLRVLGFIDEPTLLISRADRVIAMGGYNTICEILSFEKRALIVPRVSPRREQLIRAKRLQDLNLIQMLHPKFLKPQLLTEWLASEPGASPRPHKDLDLKGLARLPERMEEIFACSAVPLRKVS